MLILKYAEQLNDLFLRNKDLHVLLNEEDRITLHDLLDELSENNGSSSLHTFLSLQVMNLLFFKCFFFSIIYYYFRKIIIPLK